MLFVKMALRNIFRNKRRTLITEIAIIVGVVAIIVLGGVLSNLRQNWSDALVDGVYGHLVLMRSDYLEHQKIHPLNMTFEDVSVLYEHLDRLSGVDGCLGRLDIGGLIGTGETSTTFFGYGIDLERQPRALPKAFTTVATGTGLELRDTVGAVIGVGLAKSLSKQIGDTVLLATNTIDGQLNAIEVVIRGLMQSGDEMIDDNLVIVSLQAAQELTATPGRVSSVNIRLKKNIAPEKYQAVLEEVIKPIEPHATVKTWLDLNSQFKQVNGMFGAISLVVGLITFVIVAAGVANTMLMSVFERVREIGTITSIGTEPRQVTLLFMLEGLFLGILGTMLGIILGVLITWGSAHIGIPMTFPGMVEPIIIRPHIKLVNIFFATVTVTVMSLFAAMVPARQASRLDPIDALRTN